MEPVLVCALGMSPAVVTETLWWLHTAGEPLPARIVIVTTATGRAKAEAVLTAPGTGGLARFCRDFALPPIPVSFAVPAAADGVSFADVDDTRAAIAMADTMTAVVRGLTADPGVRVHASIAGGRKTMSHQLGYAMTLFGRAGDRLSHVLVHPAPFESLPDFFYPPPVPRRLVHPHTGGTVDTADARIELADIPFLRVRDYLPAAITGGSGPLDHAMVTRLLQQRLEPPSLVFEADGRRITLAGRSLTLPAKAYALYRLYAEAAADGWPGAGPDGIGPEHRGWIATNRFADPDDPVVGRFLDVWEQHPDSTAGHLETARGAHRTYRTKRDATGRKPDGCLSDHLSLDEERSKIRRAVRAMLNDPVQEAWYTLHRERRGGVYRSGLRLPPTAIRFA